MNKNYRELENEKTRGRKRYLERLQQTREANVELEEELEQMEREKKETNWYGERE